ncbi:MAG: hypothetical protein NC293_06470 [Roseburia sp.]|nr:hypothetical protein [Roseburia sp.]
MDKERGNIEILFRGIPYNYIGRRFGSNEPMHTYKKVDKALYMRYSVGIFGNESLDERENNYKLMLQQMCNEQGKKPSVFRLITDVARRMLVLDGEEIKCEFEQLLRWREISFQLGQDFFTCAYLANYDLNRGYETKYFSWLPIIKSNNDRIHNILKEGIAENHFHLNGSTKVFELNWLCLMNLIDGRLHDFKKIRKTLQERHMDRFDNTVKKESFYAECQRAALYRVYLFSVMKKDRFLEKKLKELLSKIYKGTTLEELVVEIQDAVTMAKSFYGAKLEGNILDYALEKSIINENRNECRLLAGERKFLYDCYKYTLTDRFSEEQKDLFYAYLVIRGDFRGEIIQINRQVGFANFLEYQDRKEYFIEGEKAYEDELVRLALNESLRKENMVSLEARICPKKTSSELEKAFKNYENIVNKEKNNDKEEMNETYNKLIYVLHFPKIADKPFVPGIPRNSNVREVSMRQARSLVALLEKRKEINRYIRGIDACSSEIACRPEVFGQIFRYLSNVTVVCEEEKKSRFSKNCKTRNLHTTYHVGEDFFDIVDGLRAIDEALLFCGLKRGSRIGHALALGIAPEEYYKFKGYKIVLSKQILLDDIAWMLCKADEWGCYIDGMLRTRLKDQFYSLYEEIFRENTENRHHPSINEYYQSWKLRGDRPELYRLSMRAFKKKIAVTELQRFDRYQFNDLVHNDLRKNEKYKELYYAYHFNEKIRAKGSEIIEFKISRAYMDLIRQLQDKMIRHLVNTGIGVETNPSSNYLIGTIKKYEEHPIIRFNSRKLKAVEPNMSLSVSINTDDQGVFDTLLENEYALMALALKKATNDENQPLYDLEDIYEWIDYVRRMGIEQIFR